MERTFRGNCRQDLSCQDKSLRTSRRAESCLGTLPPRPRPFCKAIAQLGGPLTTGPERAWGECGVRSGAEWRAGVPVGVGPVPHTTQSGLPGQSGSCASEERLKVRRHVCMSTCGPQSSQKMLSWHSGYRVTGCETGHHE